MPVQINPKLESTKKRLTILRNHIYEMSKIFEKSGSKVRQVMRSGRSLKRPDFLRVICVMFITSIDE